MEELFRRLSVLVGRSKEQELISKTVAGVGPSSLLIVGEPGIGKTRLLQEVDILVEKLEARGTDLLCLPILDFYDTAMHSEVAIEEAIVRNLAERGVDQAFKEFEEELIGYREGRNSEKQLWEAFKRGYDSTCQHGRIILRFDTAELLEYEHDDPEVLDDCDVKGLEAPALGWLTERSPKLHNTAIIIASRPNENLRKRLNAAYGKNLQLVELGGLSLEETREYFQQAGNYAQQVLKGSPETVEKVWLITNGRPIFISLSLDWLRRGKWDEKIGLIDTAELREMHKQGGKEWEGVKHDFAVALIRRFVEENTPLDKAVYYTARARKGYNTELLAWIMEISEHDARRLTNQLMKQSFVKRPHMLPPWRTEWFFLHDEIYDLMEKEVWTRFWPEYREQERLAGEIIAYYEERIRGVDQRMREVKTEKERRDLQYQRRMLLTDRLYYQFDLNPRQGLAEYERLHLQACDEKAREWDNSLRVEALRFARQRAERATYGGWVTIQNEKPKIADWVNMDCRARWVYRFVARHEYDRAVKIADKLLNKYPEADELWQASMFVSKAAAEERLGRLDEAESAVKEALRLLDELTPNEFSEWIVNYWKATAHIYRGLIARTSGELEKAREANSEAASLYGEIDYQPGEARALNNRAYILARQGKLRKALDDCGKALQIRQETGNEYGIALGLNTLGVIRKMERDFRRAWAESTRALRLFQRQRDEIGIALANINLGWAYRRWGLSDTRRTLRDIERYFELSEKCLTQAKQKEDKLEPYYQLEIHNELGCTYKDWANLLALALSADQKTRYYGLMEKADEEFSIADSLATGTKLTLERADNLEDWAWAFHLRYAYQAPMNEKNPENLLHEAKHKLNRAEEILKDCKDRVEPGLEPHLILGKVHYQHALLLAKFGGSQERDEAARDYALAATYLETYSREARELEELHRSIEGWLSQFSEDELRRLAWMMKEILDERERQGWECMASRAWIDDVILAAPALGLGR